MKNENIVVEVSTDTSQFDLAMESLTDATKGFGQVFSSTISRSIQTGKSFEDTIRSIGQRFSDLALNQALKPIEDSFGNILGSLVSGFSSPSSFNGGSFANASVTPFAKGGVVSSPTAFNFGNRLGVMGEAGAEAIMPLRRGSDGRLGVAASAPTAGDMNVIFNVTASDVESFRKSEGQLTAMLARAVSRGQRGI